ncbi:MAG TPA: peptide-N4-asparagine amidase [Kofleriaceae bacterium]|nr:peptide-N4-asparagine amidase [Kofleriaceae bacterium]
MSARPRLFALAALGSTMLVFGAADSATAPRDLVIGSGNTATADPPIAVPSTAPCVVPLFANLTFADFSPKPFSYAPSATCGAGPWAKVVLAADFAVTAGRQFDRTASIWIGGANVYFGTTAEPSAAVARSWHVENDLTDLTALLATAQPGLVQLDNLVNGTFTGVLTGRAELRFYSVAPHASAPVVPDLVLPLSAGPSGGAVGLATTGDALSRTFTLPTNVERAFLDVIAQSQSGDEFWYTCVPDALAGELQSCGATAFREAEITVDGRPAGVAPIYPWIYTGGIDPSLWRPIPGVQTLDFAPYRVDLTPFAGVLSDGKPHAVAVSVFGANNFFATTASLLIYRDPRSASVTGAVTADTLTAAPAPRVTSNITTAADGTISGPVAVTSARHYRIAGFIDTAHGRVRSEVTGDIAFSNQQTFSISSALYHQQITQRTGFVVHATRDGRNVHTETIDEQTWPLAVDFAFASNADGTSAQTTTIRQELQRTTTVLDHSLLGEFRNLDNVVHTTDTLHFDANGAVVSATDQASSQQLFAADLAGCFSRDLTAAAGVLTSVVDGAACGN